MLAGLALLSCALFVAFARYVRPESLFVAAIAWGFTGLLMADTRLLPQALHMRGPRNGPRTPHWRTLVPDGYRGRSFRRGLAVIGCAALGVAALAKDPLGLLGPLGAIAIAAALAGRFRPVRAWLPPVGSRSWSPSASAGTRWPR